MNFEEIPTEKEFSIFDTIFEFGDEQVANEIIEKDKEKKLIVDKVLNYKKKINESALETLRTIESWEGAKIVETTYQPKTNDVFLKVVYDSTSYSLQKFQKFSLVLSAHVFRNMLRVVGLSIDVFDDQDRKIISTKFSS
jgi:hypothetical protein